MGPSGRAERFLAVPGHLGVSRWDCLAPPWPRTRRTAGGRPEPPVPVPQALSVTPPMSQPAFRFQHPGHSQAPVRATVTAGEPVGGAAEWAAAAQSAPRHSARARSS